MTERPNATPGVLEKPVELLGNTVLRALHDAGYMYADHTLSAWGKAIQAAFKEAQNNGYVAMGVTETEAEEAILVAFELLKLKVLNSQHMFPTPPYSGPPLRGNDTDKDVRARKPRKTAGALTDIIEHLACQPCRLSRILQPPRDRLHRTALPSPVSLSPNDHCCAGKPS